MSKRAESLATRLEAGAKALTTFAATLSEAEWQTSISKNGRKIGVVVHHIASVYPIEIQLAQVLASCKPIEDVTWPGIHDMNSGHAKENHGVTKEADVA